MSRIKSDNNRKLVKIPNLNSIVKTRTRKYIFKDTNEFPEISILNKCSHCEFRHRIMCSKYACLYYNGNRRISEVFKLVQ